MDDYEELNTTSSLLSFRPRCVDLQLETPATELGPQRNIDGETRTKVTHKNYFGSGVIATVSRVRYGTYNEKKACLIVFNFSFLWTREALRVNRAEIQVSFDSYSKARNQSTFECKKPVVRNLSPRKIHGIPNMNGQKWHCEVEQQCAESPKSAVNLTNTISATNNSFKEDHRLEIVGKLWSDSRRREFHKGCWTIKEIGKQDFGIPDEINVAMIVEYETKFQADVKVTVNGPFRSILFGIPWPADHPVLFLSDGPSASIGPPLGVSRFETLSESDWRLLVSGYEETASSTAKKSLSSNAAIATVDNSETYRIQGIPPQYEQPTILNFLETVLGLAKDSCDKKLCSLSPSPVFLNEKVATLTTSKIDSLTGPGNRWNRSVPGDGKGLVAGERSLSTLFTGSNQIIIDTSFYGFTPLGAPPGEHEVDIIAITGLGSAHAFYSFKERNSNHMWLRDDLPFDFPQARIFTYGYDTKLVDSKSFQDLESIASTFRTALKAIRPDNISGTANDKPIIFIAHSLGGIVLKESLIQMSDGDHRDKANAQSTRGIMLFGVPSQGMNIDSLRGMVQGQPNEFLLSILREGSDTLRKQVRDFRAKFTYKTCQIVSFYETELSPSAKKGPDGWKMNGEPVVFVNESSATGGSRTWEVTPNHIHAIKRNHSELVKFYPRDPCYTIIRHILKDLVDETPIVSQSPTTGQ